MNKQAYLLVDIVFIAYLVAIGTLLIFFHKRVVDWQLIAALHVAGGVALYGLLPLFPTKPTQIWAIFLRHTYPLIFTAVYFGKLIQILFAFHTNYLDPIAIHIEQVFFVGQMPSLLLSQWIPYRWFSEIMALFYQSYYLQLLGVTLLILHYRSNYFNRVCLGLTLTFYSCYVIYILFPVRGPMYLYGATVNHYFEGYWAAEMLKKVLLMGDLPGGAIPSSHCALSILATLYAWKYLPKQFSLTSIFISMGLVLSTVYLKQHYAIDAISGVLVGWLLFRVSEKLALKQKLVYLRYPRGATSPESETI